MEDWRDFLTEKKKKKKDDRCTRIAKRKYDVWPSAYASGAVVKCRQGKIWKGVNEDTYDDEVVKRNEKSREEGMKDILQTEEALGEDKAQTDYSKEKESGSSRMVLATRGAKESQKAGLIVILVAKIRKQVKKLVNHADEKKGKKELNTHPVGPHRLHVERKGRVKNGAKKTRITKWN